MNSAIQLDATPGCRIWIDGVGCWLIWFREELLIGNASASPREPFRLRFPSALRTSHLLWQRQDESDWVVPYGSCEVNQSAISERTCVYSGDQIRLSSQVQVTWNRPSPLSGSASLDLSGSRTADHLDGVILFSETCLIGGHQQAHLPCRQWNTNWILHRQGNSLWGKTTPEGESWPVISGEVRQAGDWQVRFESLAQTEI